MPNMRPIETQTRLTPEAQVAMLELSGIYSRHGEHGLTFQEIASIIEPLGFPDRIVQAFREHDIAIAKGTKGKSDTEYSPRSVHRIYIASAAMQEPNMVVKDRYQWPQIARKVKMRIMNDTSFFESEVGRVMIKNLKKVLEKSA